MPFRNIQCLYLSHHPASPFPSPPPPHTHTRTHTQLSFAGLDSIKSLKIVTHFYVKHSLRLLLQTGPIRAPTPYSYCVQGPALSCASVKMNIIRPWILVSVKSVIAVLPRQKYQQASRGHFKPLFTKYYISASFSQIQNMIIWPAVCVKLSDGSVEKLTAAAVNVNIPDFWVRTIQNAHFITTRFDYSRKINICQ